MEKEEGKIIYAEAKLKPTHGFLKGLAFLASIKNITIENVQVKKADEQPKNN